MLTVALCDDDGMQTEILQELFYDYNSVSPYRVEVTAFSSGEELLTAIEQTGRYDIYILDVMMPEMNGLELAKRLRDSDDVGKIIFLSAETAYVYKAFSVSASGYLVKPVNPEELFKLTDYLRTVIEKERPSYIRINTEYGVRRVEVREILFVDMHERTLVYHMADGTEIAGRVKRGRFQDMVSDLLDGYPFALSSVGVAVNLANVESLRQESSEIRLKGGAELLCSRTMKDSFVRRLEDFWNM